MNILNISDNNCSITQDISGFRLKYCRYFIKLIPGSNRAKLIENGNNGEDIVYEGTLADVYAYTRLSGIDAFLSKN